MVLEKERRDMNLIEALQKWNKVTNDGGMSYFTTNSEGTIVYRREGCAGGFQPNLALFNSTGWEQYLEPLRLPEGIEGNTYFYVDEYGDIEHLIDTDCFVDEVHLKFFNYYSDRALAQYIADKALIQRINLVLGIYNKDNPDKEVLISKYIRDNYSWVIDSIKQYEEEAGI